MKKKKKITATDIYQLCLNNGWFTRGDNEQYAKVMRAADAGMKIREIAVAIWLCSDNILLEDIVSKIKDYLRWEKPMGSC